MGRPLLLALLALALPATAGAEAPNEAELSRRTQSISRTVMSPFCPGKTIDSCPSPKAQAWREDIRGWLAEGVSSEEINTRLQARTPGFDISGRPGRGWDWTLPVGAMAIATLWLLVYLRRLRTGDGRSAEVDAPAPAPGGHDELDARLDDELSRLDR